MRSEARLETEARIVDMKAARKRAADREALLELIRQHTTNGRIVAPGSLSDAILDAGFKR